MQQYNLYSDGNYFPRAKKSGFGGYIEAPNGEILIEYSEQIKSSEYQHSFELLGIIRGLLLAKSHGVKNIISHCDDKNTAGKLKEVFSGGSYNISPSLKPELFEEIIELSKSFDKIEFRYIPRNQNKYADSLSRKYASLMEQNFVRQYEDEVFRSQRRFEKEQNLNKKSYFAHNSLKHTSHKNNPFLVANVRNKKVRRVVKDEQKLPYDYLFIEIFSNENNLYLRGHHYNKDYVKTNTYEEVLEAEVDKEQKFCEFMANSICSIKGTGVTNLWATSNHTTINRILEQKEKLNKTQWQNFYKIHKSLDGFDRVFFNSLPFEHKYSVEIEYNESNKKTIEKTLLSIDQLIEEMDNAEFNREKGKYFGAIIRQQLQNYRETIERELTEIEIQDVIDETISDLNDRGCKNIPKKIQRNN